MQLAKCFEGAEETFFSKRELELEDRMGEHSERTRHSWAILQKPAKNKSKKFVKLMDHTCTYNNLKSFEYKAHPLETEIVVNLLKCT